MVDTAVGVDQISTGKRFIDWQATKDAVAAKEVAERER